MRSQRRVLLYGLLLLALVLLGWNIWSRLPQNSPYIGYPSLMPEVNRTITVRFDPSYHYSGERIPDLAESLAEKWHSHGVNRVFYRAYDPQYGSFYRTSYTLNEVGEFGRYDLLKYVLKECHDRDIQVIAWFHVLNHSGAWNAHPEWRARMQDGKDYVATGLQYPLCARNSAVSEWWSGFLTDFLEHYSDIDGIDLAEPVVSWKKGDACYCDHCRAALSGVPDPDVARAEPLTGLLGDSIRTIHRYGKNACVTTVQPAWSGGRLFSPDEFRVDTGFDLLGVLQGEGESAPDTICPEFIWQELRERYESLDAEPEVFTPDWTRSAVAQFIRWIDTPVEVLTHLEITDFSIVRPDKEDLGASMKAAIDGGADGIDIYSSSQMDQKDAWASLSENRYNARRKKCLVLYDAQSTSNDAIQTGELLRHFSTEIDLHPVGDYVRGGVTPYDNVFYVGTISGVTIPLSFIEDIQDMTATLCWLGFNIEDALSNKSISSDLGFQYVETVEDQFRSVSYKGRTLKKEDPSTCVVRVTDPEKCRILARTADGQNEVPYVVRSGRRFWYFADVPSSYAIEGGRFLVFADLLHEILNEDHTASRLALVRIEDVHPLTEPEQLKKIADFLHSRDVPFQVSLMPYYVFPEENAYVPASSRPDFVAAIRYMVRRGGTVVLHGCTHQRFGETTSDYEFWDPVGNCPPEGQNDQAVRDKIEDALRELWPLGIYPLIWETPHYAASGRLYSLLPQYFSVACERRQAIDMIGSDQYLPYLIPEDRFGQTIVPENLGYVPLANQNPDVILEPARNMSVVRDGVASFFFHPFVNHDVLKSIVRTLQAEGYTFTNVADLNLRVRAPFGEVINRPVSQDFRTDLISGSSEKLLFPGARVSHEKVFAEADGTYSKSVELKPGELSATHFIRPYRDSSLGREDDEESASSYALLSVPNLNGEPCAPPMPLLLTNADAGGASRNEATGFSAMLSRLGIDCTEVDATEFNSVPDGINLLLVPSGSASVLSVTQIRAIASAVSEGRTHLLASGLGRLADELGVEYTQQQITVQDVVDEVYSDVEIRWSQPADVPVCEYPGSAVYLCHDADTETPLLVGATLGSGRFIFSPAPLDLETGFGVARYPYLMSHLFRYFEFSPLQRSANFEIYFNPAERHESTSIEDLIKHWRRSGVRVIYVAAWQCFPEWTYDYERLIHLAHTNAMLVYAWFEPPYIHERFWLDHPEWRERNALDEEAVVSWRKPMALGDPECRRAALDEIGALLTRHDWDGVVVNRAGWESEEGVSDPGTYTPFHPTVRELFRQKEGWEPLDLFDATSPLYWEQNPEGVARFSQFREELAREWLNDLLQSLNKLKSERPYWEILLTHSVERVHHGLTFEDMVQLKAQYGLQLMAADWKEGDFASITSQCDSLQVSITAPAGQQRFYPGAPTAFPTGNALYQMITEWIDASRRFALFTESSLYEVDTQMLPYLYAALDKAEWTGDGWLVETRNSCDVVFASDNREDLLLDESPAATLSLNRMVVPVGQHRITSSSRRNGNYNMTLSKARVADFSGDLLDAGVTMRGVQVDYRTPRRAILVVNEEPRAVKVDGQRMAFRAERGLRGWAVPLPQGQHEAHIVTRSYLDLLVVCFSLLLSNAIVLVSVCAIAGLLVFYLLVRRTRRMKAK